ncbi:ABC transporter substrate-binding protein [Pigmentiphaga soli]|uniref:ABC transporter substrate-binding protein n=1 Tax=Pigmentiphaga soli TaxID=1007095 RepID=A0ABP8GS10_9BURK
MDAIPITRALVAAVAPTGALRVALNMGNPILTGSRGGAPAPAGVAVDLSHEFARRLGVAAEFGQYRSAAESLAAVTGGAADIGFMAIDPGRAEGIHFTGAYLEIIGSYVVPPGSPIERNEQVDSPGIDVVVGLESAYDLFLTRHLRHARLLRVPLSEQVVEDMVAGGHAAGAGIRQQLEADLPRFPGVRLLDGGFMVIRQAAIIPAGRPAEARAAFDAFVEWARGSGFVRDALARHGIEGAQIAASP